MHNKVSSNSQACGEQVASDISNQPQFQQIKLALDVHAASIVVARMIDGAKPQPPQSFKPADFLVWAKKQMPGFLRSNVETYLQFQFPIMPYLKRR